MIAHYQVLSLLGSGGMSDVYLAHCAGQMMASRSITPMSAMASQTFGSYRLTRTAPAHRVTHFTDGTIRSFAWSRDGKQLAVARGTQTSDVVLISGFK